MCGHPSPPQAWPYLSRRAELLWLPNEPPFTGPAVRVGGAAFYRLTPPVLAWFERGLGDLHRRHLAGEVGADQVGELATVLKVAWEWAADWLGRDDVKAARKAGGKLPEADHEH